MADDIATQMREKMENVEEAIFAIQNLVGVSSTLDGSNCDLFCDLFNFVSKQLADRFSDLSGVVKGVDHG